MGPTALPVRKVPKVRRAYQVIPEARLDRRDQPVPMGWMVPQVPKARPVR